MKSVTIYVGSTLNQKRFSLTEKIEDFGSCLTSADITIAINNMICQFVQKHELNIHVTNCNCDVQTLGSCQNPRFFQLGKTSIENYQKSCHLKIWND